MEQKNPDKMSERELRLEVKERRAAEDENKTFVFSVEPQRMTIFFYDRDNKEIAKLFENEDGELDFEGNATGAAKVFFRDVVRLNSLAIREMKEELSDRGN